jgi:hypothetical protein
LDKRQGEIIEREWRKRNVGDKAKRRERSGKGIEIKRESKQKKMSERNKMRETLNGDGRERESE